ncbi:MAG: esterase-like activity of phytase family protein [Antarcticimicrobium sp.]|uniref:esterase-like activity of phytase family protein n=1 Tax=Antarcticimicrobium sp. TaxID=2824147 RepID=UPI00261FC4A6|nr:esterase-like activity of phytase family protein [Antarcticimicrobium sp.]MDF1718007.1 esterase-like activity of phytase family protein [Antarcticimicrobium sp.]
MRLGPALAIILLLLAACDPTEAGKARFLSAHDWQRPEAWLGGFSGLQLSPDGLSATMLSDRTMVVEVLLTRDAEGRIEGVEPLSHWHLLSSRGRPLSGPIADSEGLAIGRDGAIYISFEGVHRVARYARPGARATVLNAPQVFRGLKGNRSLEALAIDAAGRLYTLPEDGRDAQGRIPVYRRDAHRWRVAFTLPARGRFKPVGADIGPDGRLYVLERAVGILGFRSRLRRWTLTEAGAEQEETLLTTAAGTHDNLEGVSVWRDAGGGLRATMISDDNFLSLQRTELVEYSLPD